MTVTEAVIEREVRIAAQPETIFPFFTEPELFARWSGAATLDPKPGGLFRMEVNREHIARGEYVLVEPPRRVIFTWGWEAADTAVPPGSSTVEVTLTRDGEFTIVRLVHRDLPGKESADSHALGWEHYLARLQTIGEGGDPGPDPGPDPRAQRTGADA